MARSPTIDSIDRQPSSVATSVSPVTQGFVAYWRSELETGFQSLIVVSYWMPGSPQTWAASAMRRKMSRARWVSIGAPPTTAWVVQSASLSTACMNESVTRTEWLAFWKKTLP